MGSLILEGIPPYARAYHGKMPGIYLVYALGLAAFGPTIAAVHLLLAIANALAIVLMFRLAARLFDDAVGVAAAALFAIASLNPEIHGLAGYAEHFVVVVALGAMLALVAAIEAPRWWRFALTGALFGLAFVLKQSGGLLVLIAFGVVLAEGIAGRWSVPACVRALLALAVGALAPFALVVSWLARAGTLEAFWFWTFRYASSYATLQSPGAATRMLGATVADIAPGAWPVLLLAALGALGVARGALPSRARAFVVCLVVVSGIAVSAGFYFRHQYFLLLLPAASLLAGLGAVAIARAVAHGPRVRVVTATALVLFAVVWQLAREATIFFRAAPEAVSRALYGRNPFPESVQIARYIRERTNASDRIVVMGSEPQIYFYAGRPAATGYIYMYPLMESQPFAIAMQNDLIREVESARPTYLVYVHVNLRASWLATPSSHPALLGWLERYTSEFDRVGIVDLVSRERTEYRWDAAAREYSPVSPYWVAVFRRRS